MYPKPARDRRDASRGASPVAPEPHPPRHTGWLDPARIFLVLAATFGVLVLFANGPWQAADENDHFFRTFQLSEGGFVAHKVDNLSGAQLPAVANKSMGDIPFHSEQKITREIYLKTLHPVFVDWSNEPRVFTQFPHTAVYSVFSYIPQTLAVFVGRKAHVGPLGLLYLARLAGFFVSVAIGYWALRLLPGFRWSALVLMVCPMSLYLLGAAVPDGLLIATSWLLLALTLRAQTQPVSRRDLAAILLFGYLLPLAKMVYLPTSLIAVLFVLPRLPAWRTRTLFVGAFAVCCLVPLAIWTHVITTIYIPGRTDIVINPSAQVHFILHHPVNFLAVVAHTWRHDGLFIYQWFVGMLGWADTPMPAWYYPFFGVGLLFCVAAEACGGDDVTWPTRAALLGAAVASVLLIFIAQYTTWNPVGGQGPIEGIEGRYFLPVMPLLIAAVPTFRKLHLPPWLAPVWGATMASLGAAVCLYAVATRYYIR